MLKPVRLPPGFATLATKPCATGSETCRNTTGMVLVDSWEVGRGRGDDHVGHQTNQLRRVDAGELGIARVPANVDAEILAFDPSQLTQPLHQCRHIRLRCLPGSGPVHQYADAPHPGRLLRARRKRPCHRRAAKQRDELPTPHVEHGGLSPRTGFRAANGPRAWLPHSQPATTETASPYARPELF